MSNRIADIEKLLPAMKSGVELRKSLAIMPDYDDSVRNENMAVRLMRLSDIYSLYVPSQMTEEIYFRLYLALVHSLQKKTTKKAVQQQNENCKRIMAQDYQGMIGGADSMSIIGVSGVGKSTAISRAINLIADDGMIELHEPYSFIIPFIVVQCPWDSSVKNLLLEILRKVDERIGSNYYQNAIKARATTDVLIGNVSQVALNHVGTLVIDETQNIVENKQGKGLVAMLTQLLNSSGISVVFVATPEAAIFFESTAYLARRALGLRYKAMNYNEDFRNVCKVLFNYQYTKNYTEINEGITEFLYSHSAGIISNVVVLIAAAQEIAIMDGTETLDLNSLHKAYKERMALLHDYITPTIQKGKSTTTKAKKSDMVYESGQDDDLSDSGTDRIEQKNLIAFLVSQAKKNGTDMVSLLRENVRVMEVVV